MKGIKAVDYLYRSGEVMRSALFRSYALRRFVKYMMVGVSTFAFDLALLFVFADILGWNYLVAAGLSFLIAVSLNYFASRRFVFRHTERSVSAGYLMYLLIATIGLCAVVSLMALAVEVFDLHYLLARVIVAGAVGVWNYLMNAYVNFRISKVGNG